MSQYLSTDLHGTVLVVTGAGRGIGNKISTMATDVLQERIWRLMDRSTTVVK